MSQDDYTDWLALLLRKAARHNLLFLQLGAAHEPARRAVLAAEWTVLTLTDYLTTGDARPGRLMVIDQVEQLVHQNSDMTMGVLREKVFADIDDGKQVVLMARAPRAAFQAVPGSSLLEDAAPVHGPSTDMSNQQTWPSCRLDEEDPGDVLCAALRELGPEVCASLDRSIFDCLLTGDEALGVLTARELEALEGAGVISRGPSATTWNFPKHLNPLKAALADVLADEVAPQPQLADVSKNLWQLERMIRRAIRSRAVVAWGASWRTQCLRGDQPVEVLKRATEASYHAATSLKLVRDPLEWLTLGELLDLKDRKEIGDLGIPGPLWRNFASDVMPIRNRLAHMRTLHPGDSDQVVKWLRVLEMKLSS